MVPVPGLFLLGLPWADDESGIERSRRAHVPRPSYAGMSRRTKWRAAICEISRCKKLLHGTTIHGTTIHGTTTRGTAARIRALPLTSNGGAGGIKASSPRAFAMRGGYSDVNWFVRATRVAPVIAGAALVGGMIGGFAMFAIDSALTWEPSTRESASPPRSDARAEGPAGAVVAQTQTMKPARIVGGAIPDPSAGMSAPPPAPQQHSAAAPAQSPAQISSQLLAPKPLGPASQLQSQTAGPTSGSAHQNPANAANAASAQQQTAPPPGSEGAASKNGDADRKAANGDRAAMTGDQDGGNTRHGRHGRRHWRGDEDAAAAFSSRRQDARGYDRLYDSYGDRRDRSSSSYSNNREPSFGDARGDQDDAASRSGLSRSEMRRLRRDARYQRRWQRDHNDRNQAFEPSQPRAEPFWGGGRRGDEYRDDD